VRNPLEFGAGRIPGAINIPLNTIARGLPGFVSDEPIVIVCQGGVRSLAACKKVELNYSYLWDLTGGTSGWHAVGLEDEIGPKDPSID